MTPMFEPTGELRKDAHGPECNEGHRGLPQCVRLSERLELPGTPAFRSGTKDLKGCEWKLAQGTFGLSCSGAFESCDASVGVPGTPPCWPCSNFLASSVF